MATTVWLDSPYTSAIFELERTADFVDKMKHDEDTGVPVSDEALILLGIISKAIRERADTLRNCEAVVMERRA
jgi:hypothetical protein